MTAGGRRRALPSPARQAALKPDGSYPPHGGARRGGIPKGDAGNDGIISPARRRAERQQKAPPGSSAGLILKKVQSHETEVYGAVLSLYVRFYAVQETAAQEERDPHGAPSEHKSELLPGHAVSRRDVLVGVVGIEEQVDRVS